MRDVRGDHPRGAGTQLLRLVADAEGQRAADQHPRLLVHVVVLGHRRPGLELDRGECRLRSGDRPTDDAVPDPERGDGVPVPEGAHVPIGCQTVFSSRKAEISYSDWLSGVPRTTRFTFSAAATSRSARSPSAPVRSIAFTSMWAASHGASSARCPVSRLTTPPGTSLVAIASASSIAASGCVSEPSATTALPPVSAGASRETSPSSGGSSGATIATTPVGSGIVKLKYGPATGFVDPSTCASLSANPAYQTQRSIARCTSSLPEQSSANSGTRASIISAIR